MKTHDFLKMIRDVLKLYQISLKQVCEDFSLTMIEVAIIAFLYHNPDKDTACDIVEHRHLSKGNVSLAVESLIQKKILKRVPDHSDRRKIHLHLLENAKVITDKIQDVYLQLYDDLFNDFSNEEMKSFEEFHQRIQANALKKIQGGKKHE